MMNLRLFTPEGAFNWLMISIMVLVVVTAGLFAYAGWF